MATLLRETNIPVWGPYDLSRLEEMDCEVTYEDNGDYIFAHFPDGMVLFRSDGEVIEYDDYVLYDSFIPAEYNKDGNIQPKIEFSEKDIASCVKAANTIAQIVAQESISVFEVPAPIEDKLSFWKRVKALFA